jgi:hypothetical protein
MALGLTIAGQSLDIAGAWNHNRSLRRLRDTVVTRGENRLIPKVAGRRAYAQMLDEMVVDLELQVYGTNNAAGTPYGDKLVGLDENLDYLSDWVRSLIDGTTATRAATLETKSGATYTADVQILNWTVAVENVTQVVIGYDLRIPSGVWTETP